MTNEAPNVDAGNDATVNEGSAFSGAATFTDPGTADTHTLTVDYGDGTGVQPLPASAALSHTYADNGIYTVTVTATDDDGGVGSDTILVTVTNVAPTVTGITAVSAAITGAPVTVTGAATDPSPVDTAAGLQWRWSVDGGAFTAFGTPGNNQFTTSFSSCAAHTVTGQARDKDGGVSNTVSATISAITARFTPPLEAGEVNFVKGGRVLPVHVTVTCGAAATTGLQPRIQLLLGDAAPGNETPGDEVPTISASAADHTGTMRPTGDSYIYNLQIPDTGKQEVKYTIRVRPLGDAEPAAAIYIVIRTHR